MNRKEAFDVAIECLEEVMANHHGDMIEHTLWEGSGPPFEYLVNGSNRYFEVRDALRIMLQIRKDE